MGKKEQAIKSAFNKLGTQQQERLERIYQTLATESDKFRKGLGGMLRQYQERIQKIHQEMRTENDTFQKNLEQVRKAVFQILEEATDKQERQARAPQKPEQVDALVNNPPNCTACEFPMVVLKEEQDASGDTQVHFVCPICNLDNMATVSSSGDKIDWKKPNTQPAAS